MGYWALGRAQLSSTLLLLPMMLSSIHVEFQSTVFSRDWAVSSSAAHLKLLQTRTSGSPWCNAGCIPNGSTLIAQSGLPSFRAPSLVQLMDENETILAISDERNVSRTRLLAHSRSIACVLVITVSSWPFGWWTLWSRRALPRVCWPKHPQTMATRGAPRTT